MRGFPDRTDVGLASTSRLFVTLFIILMSPTVFGGSTRAQQPDCTDRIISVSFLNDKLLPLPEIMPTDLRAAVRGKPVTVLSIAPDQRPHRIVLLLDSSGSMRSRWPTTTSLAEALFSEDAGDTQFALMTFGRAVTNTIKFSDGNAAVKHELDVVAQSSYRQTEVQGMSAIRDAIGSALQLFDHPTSADAIYLVTDGSDNLSKHGPEYTERILASSSVRLFVTIVSSWDNSGPAPENTPIEGFDSIAADSGGRLLGQIQWNDGKPRLTSDSNAEVDLPLDKAFSRLFETISHDYAVEIQLAAPIKKPERFKMEFSRAARKRWKHSRIIYPELVAGCPTN